MLVNIVNYMYFCVCELKIVYYQEFWFPESAIILNSFVICTFEVYLFLSSNTVRYHLLILNIIVSELTEQREEDKYRMLKVDIHMIRSAETIYIQKPSYILSTKSVLNLESFDLWVCQFINHLHGKFDSQ